MQIRLSYLLPNMVTTAALCCGFYAVLSSSDGRFHYAAVLIFIAMIFDGLDGRVARLTGAESEFGVQYDSLSDLISFGVAPAMAMYQWSLHLTSTISNVPSRLGWLAAFIYVACTAFRLARFNVFAGKIDKAFFMGLPSPAAAGVIAGFVWLGTRFQWAPRTMVIICTILLILCGLAMISNIRYFSFKTMKSDKRKVPFWLVIVLGIVLGSILIEPALMLFILFLLYALHGPVLLFFKIGKKSA